MKKLHITGSLLKVLMLGALLTGCQNEDIMTPGESNSAQTEQGAKVNAELKLVKDGLNTLQYVKSGRFTGRLSKVTGQSNRTEYSYDDSTGDLWITSKCYNKSTNALLLEIKYKIVNGKCLTSIDVSNNWTSQYIYNEVGRLDEINMSSGSLTQKKVFNYFYNAATGAERLTNIIRSTPVGKFEQIDFFYTNGFTGEKASKYYLNPEQTGLDMYLPYFGKVSDALVQKAEITPLPYTNQAKPAYRFNYGIGADGYATSRERVFLPLGSQNEAGKQSYYSDFKYSTNWQGI